MGKGKLFKVKENKMFRRLGVWELESCNDYSRFHSLWKQTRQAEQSWCDHQSNCTGLV